jgi:UDP-N-acetylglucosamine--N-acetylmuramyl-(pentapeptide) pyrophosphoryl-undecaprenol N-acetylglucosamine transferase
LHKPDAVFSTGGFVGVAPILVGKLMGASVFLHESNTIPGRANRVLSRLAEGVFVGFKFTTKFFPQKKVKFTGTPVRPDFLNINKELCRRSLGIKESRPVLLIVGGSQGAHPINELFIKSMPLLKERMANWKFIHVTGKDDYDIVQSAYKEAELDALVFSFYEKMSVLLGSATVVVSRAGASFLAELCAVGVPPLLIPFPYAADNHQFYNGLAFVKAGAGRMLEQHKATAELLVGMISQLGEEAELRKENLRFLREFNSNQSAEIIADIILKRIKEKSGDTLVFEPGKSIFAANKKVDVVESSAKRNPMLVK